MSIISIRDTSLFVQVKGQGYPLLLMHGGPGLDHTSLLPLQPLADQFKLIFYDHRCNGRSDGADVSSMTWENLTADADALRCMLGFDKWVVLGHSFGGMVALEYALRYPSSLSQLILMDTCGDIHWAQQNAPDILAKRGYRAAAVRAARRFYNGQVTPNEYFPTVIKFAGAYFYRNFFLELAHEIFSPGPHPKMRPETFIFGHNQLLPGWNLMDRLGEITVPTLVLAGRHDFLFPPEHQAMLAEQLPDSRLELIERAGHNPQMERTAQVTRIVRDFIATANMPEN